MSQPHASNLPRFSLKCMRVSIDLKLYPVVNMNIQDVLVSGKTKAAMASGGAALTIENGNVVFHCPGEFRIKAASFTFEGPAGLNTPLPVMPKSKLKLTGQYLSSR